MNKAEIIARAQTLADGLGIDPHDSPVIDSIMAAEAAFPHVLSAVARERIETARSVHDVLRSYSVEMSGGYATLPEGVLTKFWDWASLPDFDYTTFLQYFEDYKRNKFSNLMQYACFEQGRLYSTAEGSQSVLDREIASVSKAGASDVLAAAAATGNFVALEDTGNIVIVTVGGEIVLNATIEEVLTTDTVKLRGYVTGDTDLAIVAGATCRVYTPELEMVRSFTASKLAASQNVTDDATGTASSDEEEYLLSVSSGGSEVIRAVVVDVPNADTHEIAGYTATAVTGGTAVLYRRMNPVITLRAVGIPPLPTDPDEEIDATDEFLKDVIKKLAGCLVSRSTFDALVS